MKGKKLNVSIMERILSFVLAMSMLLAIAPQPLKPLFALAKEPERSLVYDFAKAFGTNTVSAVTYDNTTAGNSLELNAAVYSDPWAASYVSTATSGDTCQTASALSINMGMRIRKTIADADVFKFKIPEDCGGSYIPAITFMGVWNSNYNAGGSMRVSVGELTADGKMGAELCSVDNINSIGINGPMKVFLTDTEGEPIAFEAGKEYALRIMHTEESGKTSYYSDVTSYRAFVRKFELITKNDYQEKTDTDEGAQAETLVYDFSALNERGVNETQADADAITYEDTSKAGSAPWTVYGYLQGNQYDTKQGLYDDKANVFYHKYDGKGLTLEVLKYGAGSIMIHVPKSGRYTVEIQTDDGDKMDYYLIPLKSNRSVGKDSESAANKPSTVAHRALAALGVEDAGTYNLNSANAGAAVDIAAGEYVLLINNNASGNGIYENTINSLTLAPIKVENTIAATAIAAKPRGDSVTGAFDVLDKQGNPINLVGSFATANVADPSIADLSVEIKDGKISYALIGKSVGYTTADILAIGSDNIGAAATVDIYVNAAGRVGGGSIVYDFRKANIGEDSHNNNDYLKTITYDHTTKGSDKELNPNLFSQPWASYNLTSTGQWNYVRVLNNYQNGGIRVYGATHSPSLKIKVTETGVYMPKLHVVGTWAETMAGLNATFELSKLNADGSLTKVSTVERVNGSGIEGVMGVELTETPIEMTEGEEYVLAVIGNGAWPGYPRASIWMQKLELIDSSAYEEKRAANESPATSLTYDFTVLNDENHRNAQDIMDAISYADVIATGKSAAWKLYTAYARNFITSTEFFKDHETAFLYTTENAGITLNGQAGGIMLHVPADGDYVVSFDAQAIGSDAKNVQVTFHPLTERRTVEDRLDDISVNLTVAEGEKTYKLNQGIPINLKAGEYLLFVNSGKAGHDLTFNKVTMDLCDIAYSIDSTPITAKPRTTSEGTIAVLGADGNPISVSGKEIVFSSSDTSVAQMTGEIKDGKISYTLESKGAGEAEIGIFLRDDSGVGAQGTVKVYVNRNARIGAAIPVFDLRKINVGTEPVDYNYANTITYNHTMVGGTREVNPGMYSEPWAAIDLFAESWNYVRVLNQYQSMGLRFFNIKAPRSMKFRVDEAGTYVPTLVIAGTWEDLAGMNAQFEFGYNSPTGYKKLSLASGVNASAIDGYFTVELTDGAIEMAEGEYMLTITNNGIYDASKYSVSSLWIKSMELREPREKLAKNEEKVKDLVYDFTVLNDDEHRGYQDAAYAISFKDTKNAGSEPWKVYSAIPENYSGNSKFFGEYDPALYYDAAGRGLSMVGFSGAVRMHVPADGWYIPSFELWSSATNEIDVSFMSLADNDSPVDEISSMSFAPSTTKKTYTMNDKLPVHLTAGEYILFVRAKSGNDVYLESFTLDNNNAALSIKEQGIAAKIGETVSGSFVVYNNDEETDMTGANIEFKVADPSIGDFKLFISGGKLCYSFKNIKRGMTTVQMSVVDKNDNGIVKTISLSGNPEGIIVGEEHYYNFRKLEGSSGLYELSKVNDIAMTTAGNALEINPEIASSPWAFAKSNGKFIYYSDSFNGITIAPNGASASFKIKVTTGGSYQIVPEATVQMNGAKVDVYIAPVNAEDVTAAEYYVATADTYAPSRKIGQERALAIADLDAGEYIVTFKINGKSELVSVSDIRADIAALKLKPVDFHTKMTVLPAFYPGSIRRGEFLELPLIIKETDAKTEWVPDVTVSVLSLDPSIATAEVISNEDNTEHVLKFTATKAGKTVLNVTVSKKDGDIATVSIPVFVTDTQAIASRTYKYRFKNTAYLYDQMSVIDSYSKITPGSPDEYRDGSGTDRWYTLEHGKGFFRYYQDVDNKSSVYLAPHIGMYATIVIDLPESGIYEPQVPYTEHTYGGIGRMWIAPMDAEDARADEYSVGTLSTAMTDGKEKTGKFRTVELEAGEYKVSWEIIDNVAEVVGNASVPKFCFYGVDMVPVTKHSNINITTVQVPDVQLGTQANAPLTASIGANEDIVVYANEDLFGASFEETSDLVDIKLEYDEDDKPYAAITGIAEGSEDVTVNLVIDGEVRGSFVVPVTVVPAVPLDKVTLELKDNPTASLKLRDAGTYIADLIPTLYNTSGNIITADGAQAMGVTYEYISSNESIATVSDTGAVEPIGIGNVTVTCKVTIGNEIKTASLAVRVDDGKTESTYYTAEEKANARENVGKYSWARSSLQKVEDALKPYLEPGMDEYLWNLLSPQEVPRASYPGSASDPEARSNVCRYCGVDLTALTGKQHCPWLYDVINSPWKLQCPACRRKFPSNDFGAFYEIGIDEHGNWSYEQAKELGSHLLTNDLYPEMGPGWGVDDGYGYDTGRELVMTTGKVTTIKYAWIACYNHWARMGSGADGFGGILGNLTDAYLWTGDVRYGRLGAILTDRYADLYPDYDIGAYAYFEAEGEHYQPTGKVRKTVWDNGWAQLGCKAYDAFYEMYDDPYVIDFLTKKAQQYDLPGENKKITDGEKLTSGMIRENCEDGLLREVYKAVKYGEVNGNFGTMHLAMTTAAVVLDNFPETQEWIDWCFQSGHGTGVMHTRNVTGGNIDNVLVNNIDRDGGTRETAPNYSVMWPTCLADMAAILSEYKAYTAKNLFENPKYLKSLAANMPLVNGKRMTVPIGDSGSCASDNRGELYLTEGALPIAWRETKNPFYAQALYFSNGDSAKGLKYDIYTKDPERLETEIANAIKEHGEYDFYSSNMLGGFGFAVLRAGEIHDDLAGGYRNTMQDFWIHFGHNTGHAHDDIMHLGIDAFGLDIAPDLGYPINSSGDEAANWEQNTISHNTVIVDKTRNRNPEGGEALHFDDVGRVKVMDIEGADAMTDVNMDKFRRTVVMVQATEEICYGIDFFHVVGGNEHVYSFHALSDELTEKPTGIELTPQVDKDGKYVGTYAGADIPHKTSGISTGYSYLYNIDKVINPGVGEFEVDFKIKDFRGTLPVKQDMHLRMSMLNEDAVEEVVIANGEPAQKLGNPRTLKYMLVRNMGGKSLFTTVMEPYGSERYLSDSVQIPRSQITYAADDSQISDDEVVRAIKVIFKDEARVDYIIYAQNNEVEYKIIDGDVEIPFKGFVGVYTLDKDGKNVYSYVNDGTKLGDLTAQAAFNGSVNSFTDDLELKNYINVNLDGNAKAEDIIGRYVYIDGESYKICDAKGEADGSITIDIGDISLVKTRDDDGNYTFHMKKGDNVKIPLSAYADTAPVITNVENEFTVAAGSSFGMTVTAYSPSEQKVKLSAIESPRGASFDANTNTIKWTPDSNQIGKHIIAVKADDGALQSIKYFTIEVVRSTGGITQSTPADKPDAGSGIGSDSGTGAGSGVGGGAGASSGGDTSGDTGNTETGDDTGDNTDDVGDGVLDVPSEKFIDLGNHTWAKDAIYALVEKGVVNGTSPNTYSPANNIKRADFAIMLVRAFGVTEGETEQFADVDTNKYYAKELLLAKANGIVGGIGENKFNPEGEITRQDMMLMLTRALEAQGKKLDAADESVLAQFADAAEISDYAKQAVASVVKAGVIAGSNGRINPLARATRAEIAVMLNRVLAK